MATIATNIYPEVERELVRWLAEVSPDPREIDVKIAELESRLGARVYSELLYLLSHLDFAPSVAKSHWNVIIEHREALASGLGREVDFRVALLDYFISVNQHFENPKIIEIKIFQKTQESAIRDELTGLHNYRCFRSELDRELTRARRTGTSVSLALFDVDHFKWYNDRNGHLAGDRALRALAVRFRDEVRSCDLVARYGGEEFAILLPEAKKSAALEVARRICTRIAESPFEFGSHQPGGRLSVSGGVAAFRADADAATSLIEAADRGLYLAKSCGRNRVLSADDETREHPRIDIRIPGTLRVLENETRPLQTQNVSEQGLQFRSAVPVEEGEVFRFSLNLEPIAQEVVGVARAMRIGEREGGYEVAAHIVEMSFADSQGLRAFLAEHGTHSKTLRDP